MTIHIASPEVARRIRRIKITTGTCVAFVDNLAIGPCTAEPAQLARVRGEYGLSVATPPRSLQATHARLLASVQSADEVVVWSSGSLQHTVLLWMICALLNKRPGTTVHAIVQPRITQHPDDPFGCVECDFRTDEIRALLGDGKKLSSAARRAATCNWRAFTEPLPMMFNERCRARATPELDRFGKYHAGFFPRLTENGLRLSLLDELLLSCAGTEWSFPWEIIMRRSPEGMALRAWLACAGDVSLGGRLRDWAHHSVGHPILESQTAEGDHILTGVKYRLSSRGQALLAQGLRRMNDAPAYSIGGAAAYDPDTPVALSGDENGGLVRL